MATDYDRWLQSGRDYERFAGLDGPDEAAQDRRDMDVERQIDARIDRALETSDLSREGSMSDRISERDRRQADAAFQWALEHRVLVLDELDPLFVGNFMYMGAGADRLPRFKNITTRRYLDVRKQPWWRLP